MRFILAFLLSFISSIAIAQSEYSTGQTPGKVIAPPTTAQDKQSSAILASLNRTIKLAVESRLLEIQDAVFFGNDSPELINNKINEMRSLLQKYYLLKPKKLGKYLTDLNLSESETFQYYAERTDIYLNGLVDAYSRNNPKERKAALEKIITLSCRSCHDAFAPSVYDTGTNTKPK